MIGHWRAGRVRVGPGLAFGIAGAGGSYIGSLFNRLVPPNLLPLLFAGLMGVAAWRMWGRHVETPGHVRQSPWSNTAPLAADAAPARSLTTVARVVAAGTVVGLLTGFFGVGGGFVIGPALVLALGYTMPVAVGTSLLVIAVSSAKSLGFRLQSTSVDWAVAGPFTLAGVLGVMVGDWIAGRVPANRLTRGFVGLIVAVALYTVWQSATRLLGHGVG
jgi:uncharacterized membrane protein YfcA